MGEFHPGLFLGTQLEWFYQLERTNFRNWEDLAAAFYKQYQYNADLASTRTQLQSMSMGSIVPQNFPSHFTQHMPIEVLNLLKDAQELIRQTPS